MNMLKKTVALLLAVVFVFTLGACHQKDEVAVESGKYKITSAMYSYYLYFADLEAKNLISESSSYNTSAENFSYYKQTIDGKSYNDYVKDLALDKCIYNITLQKLCDEKNLKLSDEETQNYKNMATAYWNYYLGTALSANGVSYSTYEKIQLNDALYNLYFENVYGKGGDKEVDDSSIQSTLEKNYAAIYMIEHNYSDEDDADTAAIQKDLEAYKAMLEDGKAFDEVLAAYEKANSDDSDDKDDADKDDDKDEDKDEEKPKDENIVIITNYEDTNTGIASNVDYFDDVAKMEKDAVQILHDTENKTFRLIVKKDITTDSYYKDNLTTDILYSLKQDEFDDFIAEYKATIKYDVSKYAINQFKVKKISDDTEA